jgi:hypothetical protein
MFDGVAIYSYSEFVVEAIYATVLCCLTLMSWYSKERQTVFDSTPIEGLFFVDGNIFERVNRREYAWGMKNPRIVFPSGEDFEVWDEEHFFVNINDAMDLPYFDTCQEAFERAKGFITTGLSPINYIEKLNDSNLLLYSEPNSAGCIVTYTNGRMTNIQSFIVEVEGEK